jgi:hypothetical protein
MVSRRHRSSAESCRRVTSQPLACIRDPILYFAARESLRRWTDETANANKPDAVCAGTLRLRDHWNARRARNAQQGLLRNNQRYSAGVCSWHLPRPSVLSGGRHRCFARYYSMEPLQPFPRGPSRMKYYFASKIRPNQQPYGYRTSISPIVESRVRAHLPRSETEEGIYVSESSRI